MNENNDGKKDSIDGEAPEEPAVTADPQTEEVGTEVPDAHCDAVGGAAITAITEESLTIDEQVEEAVAAIIYNDADGLRALEENEDPLFLEKLKAALFGEIEACDRDAEAYGNAKPAMDKLLTVLKVGIGGHNVSRRRDLYSALAGSEIDVQRYSKRKLIEPIAETIQGLEEIIERVKEANVDINDCTKELGDCRGLQLGHRTQAGRRTRGLFDDITAHNNPMMPKLLGVLDDGNPAVSAKELEKAEIRDTLIDQYLQFAGALKYRNTMLIDEVMKLLKEKEALLDLQRITKAIVVNVGDEFSTAKEVPVARVIRHLNRLERPRKK